MIVKKIAVLGLGLIGGSFAKALKQSNPGIYILGYDRPNISDQAIIDKTIIEKLDSITEALVADLIFLCLPIDECIEAFRILYPKLKSGQILSDFCSVKKIFAEESKKIGSDGIYIGAHPMTGKEKSGYANSDPLLFENATFIVCKEKDINPDKSYIEIIKLTGARIILLDAALHDQIVSRVSHLPQLLAVALVNQASEKKEDISLLDFAAGGFRDMTRIASSDFSLWKSILSYNKKEILDSLDAFAKATISLHDLLKENMFYEIEKLFTKARVERNEIPINTKGFIDPLYDITVFVKDEPGMISKISTVLFENKINIKDIELLKIREGTGGNFKFYFESSADASKAKTLIEKIGFTIK